MLRKIVGPIVVAALIASGLAIAAAPVSAAGSRWSITPSPSPPGQPDAELSAVACASPRECFAVGASDTPDVTEPFIERWDGTSWTVVPSPSIGSADSVNVDGIACPSPTSCVAVGDISTFEASADRDRTLALAWNGAKWSIVPSATPVGADLVALSGVSCASATDCFAVGIAANFGTGPRATAKPLIEHWNGSVWSIVAGPNEAGGFAALSGVSCSSSTSCFAVGAALANKTSATLTEHWDGAAWSIVPSPNPPEAGPDVSLSAVRCLSDSYCFAAGTSGHASLIEFWNGAMWSIVTSPSPAGVDEVELNALDCANAYDCFAVGAAFSESSSGESGGTLIEHWDGASWKIVPGAGHAAVFTLAGIACPSVTSCAAVGDDVIPIQWNGAAWVNAPFSARSSQSHLSAVSCALPTDCFAVGRSSTDDEDRPLIEHWNGASWSIVASPDPPGSDESLNAISCPSRNSCMAVGSRLVGFTAVPLVERWNGKQWSIVPSPTPPKAQLASFSGVSCASTTDCSAVGFAVAKLPTQIGPLAEHWNGKVWTVVPSATPKGAVLPILAGVSCVSPTSCTAVGSYEQISTSAPTISGKTLVERWDGTRWSVVASPSPAGALISALSSVSCTSASSCSAVGAQLSNLSAGDRALAERWNGTSWTTVPTPKLPGVTQTELLGIACRGASNCDAVGIATSATSTETLVEHYNGGGWARVASPNPAGSPFAALSGISCPSMTSCTSVGGYYANASLFTLVERGK